MINNNMMMIIIIIDYLTLPNTTKLKTSPNALEVPAEMIAPWQGQEGRGRQLCSMGDMGLSERPELQVSHPGNRLVREILGITVWG